MTFYLIKSEKARKTETTIVFGAFIWWMDYLQYSECRGYIFSDKFRILGLENRAVMGIMPMYIIIDVSHTVWLLRRRDKK